MAVEFGNGSAQMSHGFSVRRLLRADPSIVGRIAALTILAWGREPGDAEVAERTLKLLKEFATADPSQKAVFLAIGQQGDVVGVARVMRSGGDPCTWVLYGVAVHPQHRRRGIGRAMAKAAVDYAREHGCQSVRSAAHADNDTSLCFHQGLGFRNKGVMIDADGDRVVTFELDLRP